MSISQLVSSNINSLTTAKDILMDLPSECYCKVEKPYFDSSIGKHTRHILDHYLCFLRDFPSKLINYDRRHRDPRLECDKAHTISVIAGIQKSLALLMERDDESLQVIMCQDVSLPEGEQTVSSLSRELLFLQGHTVHHYALIATILKLGGQCVNSDFGVAPSTLVYENSAKASS